MIPTLIPALLSLLACSPQQAPSPMPPASDTSTPGISDSDSPPDPPVIPSGQAPATLVGRAAPACADPSARDTLGPFTGPVTAGDWGQQRLPDRAPALYAGGGLAVGDVDDDGRLDILLPGRGRGQLFLQTAPRQFTDATDLLPPAIGEEAVGAAFADTDADGDLDVLIAGFTQADQWWVNQGGGRFVDATAAAGLTRDPALHHTSPVFADVDRDGDLDALVPGSGPFEVATRISGDRSWLYFNNLDGTFTERGDLLPEPLHQGYTFVATWVDLDRDGRLDLYAVNDFGHVFPNTLVWSRAGTFVADDGSAGLGVSLQGMGLGIGDVDGDGGTDLAMAGWGSNRLMMESDGRWFNASAARGLVPDAARGQVIGWATVLADVDNDLDLDVVEGFGFIRGQSAPREEPDELYLNHGGMFEAVGHRVGFDHPGQTRAVLAVDVDGDGWLDLLRRDLTGPATLQLGRCGEAAWLSVSLHDPTGANLNAIGARVTVRAPGHALWRDITAGGTSVMAGGPPMAHFGLGAFAQVDVDVAWPDGAVSSFSGVSTRRHVDIHRQANHP